MFISESEHFTDIFELVLKYRIDTQIITYRHSYELVSNEPNYVCIQFILCSVIMAVYVVVNRTKIGISHYAEKIYRKNERKLLLYNRKIILFNYQH